MTISRQEVFAQLHNLGLREAQVRAFLPAWMTDEALETASGLAHLKVLLVRRFGIDPEALFTRDAVSFYRPASVSYKRSIGLTEEAVTPAAAMAVSAASHALAAFRYPYHALPPARELRQLVLGSGAKYVGLNALVHFATQSGLPVIPVRALPAGVVKMDGLAVMPRATPAIAIARRSQFSAWYAFILAHEFGHIFYKHVTPGRLLIDESFDEDTFSSKKEDKEESEADKYALELLGGGVTEEQVDLKQFAKPGEIAKAAMKAQRLYQVDAGHLILRGAYSTGNWQLFISALQIVNNNPLEADEILTRGLAYGIDWPSLPEESIQFLEHISEISVDRTELAP